MARNYKRSTQTLNKKRSSHTARNTTAIKWLCIGVALGIAVIMVIPQLPLTSFTKQIKSFSLAAFHQTNPNLKSGLKKEDTKKGSPKKQDSSKQSPPPSFDFYTLLPEMKVEVPVKEHVKTTGAEETAINNPSPEEQKKASESTTPPLNTTNSPPPESLTRSPTGYSLQFAAFKSFPDADAYKSNLLLRGLPVKLQAFTTEKGESLYRVKMGPYKNKRSAERDKKKFVAMNFKELMVVEELN